MIGRRLTGEKQRYYSDLFYDFLDTSVDHSQGVIFIDLLSCGRT